ncbi:unnamed protein product [Candida parapsilosis]|uniref:Uncharacterized protein n=1 Tax=Candida parapsilosis (strain CDC 317 / ATCC MYA-4646) TaxID=578454 RepID=G8BH72_CANPC|nr:uncharacterized protein CPAR2_500220 [Candida parapsilosis]CCE43796.1 hypothetical protein CPAR2_500220 [Candida parapsilosis]
MSTIEDIIKSIPAFKESRLNSLYSNFQKNKQLNPEGYEANIQAWKSLFTKIITSNKFEPESVVSIPTYNPSLKESLSLHPYNEPKNLSNILQEFVNDKFLIPASLYTTAKESYFVTISGQFHISQYFSVNSWQQWRALKSYSIVKQGRLVDDRFIYWDELVKLGQKIAKVIETKVKGDTYSSILFNHNLLFDEISKHVAITSVDYDLLLKHLSRDVKLLQTKVIDGVTFIKISQEEISPEDQAVVQVKQTINNLETRVKEVESKLNSIDFKSVLKLPKDAQKSSLRSKMAMKANLVKLLDKNVNLELEMTTLLQKINDSNFNSAYFSVLEASAKTLSKLNSQLKIDDVDRVKVDIDEEITKEEEIGDALAGEAEDVDVDEELNKMLDEEEKAKEEAAKEENVKEEKAKNDNAEEEAKQQNADKEKERELLSRLENLTVDDVIKQSPQHDSPATIVPFEQSH